MRRDLRRAPVPGVAPTIGVIVDDSVSCRPAAVALERPWLWLAAAAVVVAGVGGAVAGALPLTAAALLAGGLVVGLERPDLAAPAVALFLPVGFAVADVGGAQIGLLDALVWGVAAGYAGRFVRERRVPTIGRADVVAFAFAGGVAVSGASAVGKTKWLHELALWVSLAVLFHCGIRALARPAPRRRLYAALAVALVTEAVYAIVEFGTGFDSRFSVLGGAIVYPQPEATLEHPNALGGFLAIGLFLAAGAALAARRARWLWAGVVVLAAAGVLAPFSRGAWIAAAGGMVALVLCARQSRRLVGAAVALAAVGIAAVAVFDRGALGSRITSLFNGDLEGLYGFRGALAHRALDVIAAHPVTGAGTFAETGMYAGRPALATHPHDLVLGVGVFFGIPAALAFLALLALAVRGAWRASRARGAVLAAEGAGAAAAIVALLVDGLFEYPFWNTTWTVEIALLLILCVALGRARDAEGA